MDINPRAVMGDNAPPDPLMVEMGERIENADRWLQERPEWEKWDAEMADKANFFIEQIAATRKALDDRRLAEGRDFKLKQDAVYKDPLSLLDMAKDKMATLRRSWLRREDDRVQEARRKAEAEAKRLADEADAALKKAQESRSLRIALEAQKATDIAAEAAAEAAAIPDKARISGTFSSRARGLNDYWSAEVTDITAAFKHYNNKNNPNRSTLNTAILAAIQSIATNEARRIKDETAAPPGIKFIKERR